jgi:hypothetical protein
MADQIPCPGCRHANPPENRFCGWCGASLLTSTDLMTRRAGTLTVMGHALPVKPGAIGTALAVGLGTLAMQVAMFWLRHRFKADDRSSTLATREHDTAMSEYYLGQGIGKILIRQPEEAHQGHIIAWQAISSIAATEWTTSSRGSARRPRGGWSSGGSRASLPPFE